MVRGKVHLKKIENPVHRRVTFSKRKGGLLKKAKEISTLCDAEVGLIIFSQTAKLYDFASPSMNRIIERYQKYFLSIGDKVELSDHVEALWLEVENLQRRMIHLEKNSKHMIGEDLELLNFKELQCLEKKISLGARKIHSRKEKVSVERIRSLKIKEKSLTVENANLEKKIGASIAIKNLETDAATQQDLPQTNLNLIL
ncbi:hypothetical protein SUGI_0206220 [Cryptomeria japonica]|nr:hypothetical protein SUGI_0206220 [Cryptomeria japonica]